MSCKHYVLGLAALLISGGCDDSFPEASEGGRISGKITYQGDEHKMMSSPAVLIAAFVDYPPTASPHALEFLELEGGNFPETGVEYDLLNVIPFDFFVVGTLVDMDAEIAPAPPIGSFPNACVLTTSEPNVSVTDTVSAEGIDLEMFDLAGATDPCNLASSGCPDPGKTSLILNIAADVNDVDPSDILVAALFDEWPSAVPSWFRTVTGNDLVFPQEIIDDALTPGSYVLTFCYDRGGDDIFTGGCGDEDLGLVYLDEANFELIPDKVVIVNVDLSTGVSIPPVVTEPMCSE